MEKRIVYKKTDERYIVWQRGITNDNEWHECYNKWQRITTGDNKWYNEWQGMTTIGTTSDNKPQRVTTSDNEWQRMTTSDNEWYNEW